MQNSILNQERVVEQDYMLRFLKKRKLYPKLVPETSHYPAGNNLFKFNDRNTTTRCEICSKLTIIIPE